MNPYSGTEDPPAKNERQIAVRLPQALLEALDRAASRASETSGFSISRAAMARRCIEAHLDEIGALKIPRTLRRKR